MSRSRVPTFVSVTFCPAVCPTRIGPKSKLAGEICRTPCGPSGLAAVASGTVNCGTSGSSHVTETVPVIGPGHSGWNMALTHTNEFAGTVTGNVLLSENAVEPPPSWLEEIVSPLMVMAADERLVNPTAVVV